MPANFNGGLVLCCGWNQQGQAGTQEGGEDVLGLREIPTLSEQRIKSISCGLSHTLCLRENGEIFTFGFSKFGRLGVQFEDDGGDVAVRIPRKISSLSSIRIVGIACGAYHSVAVSNEGIVYSWGKNDFGQLGLESTSSGESLPKIVELTTRNRMQLVAAGGNRTMMITFSGDSGDMTELYGCGETMDKIPQKIENIEDVVDVALGFEHNLAVTCQGHLYGWGGNKYGQLGIAARDFVKVPTKVNVPHRIRKVAAGWEHSAVVAEVGFVLVAGRGDNGQLGLGETELLIQQADHLDCSFRRISGSLEKHFVTHVDCGSYHTAVLTKERKVFGFGLNDHHQLSASSTQIHWEPIPIGGSGDFEASTLGLGGRHSVIATNYRPLVCIQESSFTDDSIKMLSQPRDFEIKISEDVVAVHRIVAVSLFNVKGKAADLTEYDHEAVRVSLDFVYNFDSLKTAITAEQRRKIANLAKLVKSNVLFRLSEFSWENISHPMVVICQECYKRGEEEEEEDEEEGGCNASLILSDGVVLKVHKEILGCRCPHFAALFSSSFKESMTNEIELEMTGVLAKPLMQYIYTDGAEIDSVQLAIELMICSDMFMLPRLRTLCEKSIETKINAENVVEIYEYATMANANQLKAFCEYFIAQQSDLILTAEVLQAMEPNLRKTLESVCFLAKEAANEQSNNNNNQGWNCIIQ